jgi:hypothetical protein
MTAKDWGWRFLGGFLLTLTALRAIGDARQRAFAAGLLAGTRITCPLGTSAGGGQ